MWGFVSILTGLTVGQIIIGGFKIGLLLSIISRLLFFYNFLGKKPDLVAVGALEFLGFFLYPFYCFISATLPEWKFMLASIVASAGCYYLQYYNNKHYAIVILEEEDYDDEE